jgi:uncharacterized surface protein with fasciclin (FAS1) repeats
MKKNQFRGAIATILGLTLTATGISASQAETSTTKPSAAGTAETKNPAKKSPSSTSSPTPSASSESTTPGTSTTPSSTKPQTIVELASASKQFKTLVAAVKAAGLAETLSGEGPFTLFAPNDNAFNKLPKGTLKKLLKPENKVALQKILKYHLLSSEVMAADVKSGSVATVEGKTVKIAVTGTKVKVNTANVIKTDIKASNGVVHTIDTVLMPPDVKIK